MGRFTTDDDYDGVDAAQAVIGAEINMAGWWCCNHQLIV